jgi:RNA polymerase sigma-70 factor (ECF subfamily)
MKKRRFKKIVCQYKDLVYCQAYYFTCNKEDAEDITQEVLLKLWHHLDTVTAKTVKSWLMKVTRNVCIDHSRKKREQSLSEFEPEEQHQIMNRLGDTKDDPEHLIMYGDLLQQGFQQLPENLRSIVIMREIQDLSYGLIAEIVDLPLNTVKVYLHRGRKLLAQYLKEHCGQTILTE